MGVLKPVILYYNKPSLTGRCLASVRAALSRAHAGQSEIVMIDNGSAETFDGGPGTDTRRLEPNQGFGRGMNSGLKAAFSDPQATHALLLSNDVELPANFFQAFASLELDARPPELLCPHVHYLHDKARRSYTHGRFNLVSHELSHHFDEHKQEIRFPDYYPAAATIWSRAAFERLGGFDERYFCYWEDVELAHRCARDGVRLTSAATLLVHHLGRGTTGKKRAYSRHFKEGRDLTLKLLREDA